MKKIVSISIIMIASCIVISFASTHWWFNQDKFETYQVPIKIGDNTFSFQRNYLWNYRKENTKDNNGYANIRVLMPKFEKINKDNYSLLKEHTNMLDIVLSYTKKTNEKPHNIFYHLSEEAFNTAVDFSCKNHSIITKDSLSIYDCGGGRKLYTNTKKDFLFECTRRSESHSTCHNIGSQTAFGNLIFSLSFDEGFSSQSNEIFGFAKKMIETAKHAGEK